jgi:hypothetical protein
LAQAVFRKGTGGVNLAKAFEFSANTNKNCVTYGVDIAVDGVLQVASFSLYLAIMNLK